MKVAYKKINLPFEYPFTISGGRTKTHQPSLIVSLAIADFIGYGEAPAIYYYNISVEQMIADLESKKNFVEKFALTEPERYWHYLHHLFPKNPFLVCALDMACWNLFSAMKNISLYKLWNIEWKNIPLTDYTIGIESIEKMVEKMQAHPLPIYKIKVGFDDDVQMIEALRKHSNSIFRVDANGGWKLKEAIEKINSLKDLGVELIEQPLAKENFDDMKILFEKSPLPLFADESCVMENDVEKCVNYFHGINIKLTKCSGITPALRIIKKARDLNLKIMLGSMNESSIGSAALASLAPQADYLDIDGPLLLHENDSSEIKYYQGNIILSK